MIRWSEHQDEYLVMVSGYDAAFWNAIIALALTAAGVISLASGVPCFAFAAIPAAIGFGIGACMYLDCRAWVAIPVRGGPVRWGGRRVPTQAGDVLRFEVGRDADSYVCVFAFLRDGRRETAIGMASFPQGEDLARLVKQLNEVLPPASGDGTGGSAADRSEEGAAETKSTPSR